MGRPPAVVIIARHGARLDAADKQWHLSSPTPYDPPLTYGGWVQSRALGNRIGSILHASYGSGARGGSNTSTYISEDGSLDGPIDGHTLPGPNAGHEKKRAYKVIIHTSPFLRCIQTSIAIGAGITQYEGSIRTNGQPSKHHPMHSEAQHPAHPASPYLTGMENPTMPHLAAIPEPEVGNNSTEEMQQPVEQVKPCLRIDAFLGEWLSPDYFDMITPPPNSIMMLTSAKAELMRQGEYVDVPAGSYRSHPDKGNSFGLWGSGSSATVETRNGDDSEPLSNTSTVGATLPRLNRASSHSNVNRSSPNKNNRINPRSVSKIETSALPGNAGYEPPTPSYAVSPSGPIPPGYVAHARDACTNVDFQWDSIRQPHDWGTGGEYGEEWSGMHKRFRRGLQSMVAWYEHNDAGLTTQNIIDGSSSASARLDQADDEADIVLILVTHGAGCNALLGALTNQPVLLDVGMASLTLAVRKEPSNKQAQSPVSPNHSSRQRSSIDTGVSNEYEVKIIASTDHLHARGRSSTAGMIHYSPSLTSSPISYHRYRTNSAASTASSNSFTDGDFSVEFENRAMNSIDPGGGSSRSTSFSGGLWSKPSARNADGSGDRLHMEKEPLLNGHSPLAKEVSSDGKLSEVETDTTQKDNPAEKDHRAPDQPSTQDGLWGAPEASTANERENGIKRRWTHSAHG
ncbi:MAG: hypothetical protein L6R38_009212 [Xanthoria sp. 2 TBL-2021]|nr:MAG: hypothetical protein L6R38_009212 [Xanthoria sp. 2 TBL-2021]